VTADTRTNDEAMDELITDRCRALKMQKI